MIPQEELLGEIDRTIQLLEAELPANPASPRNEKLEAGLEKSLSQYFKALNNALDWNELERIYLKNVKQE